MTTLVSNRRDVLVKALGAALATGLTGCRRASGGGETAPQGKQDGPDAATRRAFAAFGDFGYQRINARRMEHLASLGIYVAGKSVLEPGAGTGDLSHYFVDRGCSACITDVRPELLQILRERYPGQDVQLLDAEHPQLASGPYDVVFCYGLLYHLGTPLECIEFFASKCREVMLLETCVSFGDDEALHLTREFTDDPSQSASGRGCRPTRPWVMKTLRANFEHVYLTRTQPNHEQFPVDWRSPPSTRRASHGRSSLPRVAPCRAPFS